MSLVKILVKPITGVKKNILFVIDGSNVEPKSSQFFNYLVQSGNKPISVNVQGIQTYNALRGYLDEKGVEYQKHGDISKDHLFRLEDVEDIKVLNKFFTEIKHYEELENKVHSAEDEEKITSFNNYLKQLASKYK